MTKKRNTKVKDLIVKEVDFNGDSILTIQETLTDKKYVSVNYVAQAIGLSEDQCKKQSRNIQNDIVLSKGFKTISAKFGTQIREYACIELDFLPLWLAKISITPDMIQNKPDVVHKLIEYQLKAKDVLAEAFLKDKKVKEEWSLARQVGIIDRNRMTYSIKTNIPDTYEKQFLYGKYTNTVYQILFGKTASDFKVERNCKNPRDAFTKEELQLVDEAETIVTALIALGFTYEQVVSQLKTKFNKQKCINSVCN